jgi:hypothetical protein
VGEDGNMQDSDVSRNGGFLAEDIIYITITASNLSENSETENYAQHWNLGCIL